MRWRRGEARRGVARCSLSFCVVGNVVTSRRHDGTQFGNLGSGGAGTSGGGKCSLGDGNPLGNFAAKVGKCGDKSAFSLPRDERSGPSFNCLTSSVALAHPTPRPPSPFNPFMTEMGRKRVVYGLVKPWGLQAGARGRRVDRPAPNSIHMSCEAKLRCGTERNGRDRIMDAALW